MVWKRSLLFVLTITFILMVVGCISSKGDSTQRTMPTQKKPVPSPPSSLAPGTADVSAVVQACTEHKKNFICFLRIKTVHGYGSATPPLPAGTVIQVRVPKSLIEKNSRTSSQMLKKGNNLKVILSHEGPVMGESLSVYWHVIRFH